MTTYNFPQFPDHYDGYKMRAMVDEMIRQFQGIQLDSPETGGSVVTAHEDLTGRSDSDQHPIVSITGLQAALASKFSQAAGAALTITVNNHEIRITANEAALASLGARVTANEGDIASQGARITANETELDFARTQRYFFGE